MDVKDIKQLLNAVSEADLNEFVLETGDYKLSLKRGGEVIMQAAPTLQVAAPQAQTPAPSAPVAAAPIPAPVAAPEEVAPATEPAANLYEVTAPIVGTFYEAPTPEEPSFVKVGDKVESGKVLCIIEAMKLMNEIEAEVSGTIVEILVANEDPVEYGQALFRIDPA